MSYLPLIDLKNGFWPVVHLLYGISEWNFTDMLIIKGYILWLRIFTLTFPVHELSTLDWSEKWFLTCSSFTIWNIWMKLHRYVEHQRLHIFSMDRHPYLSSSWVIRPWLIWQRTITLTFPVHELSALDWSEKWFLTCSSFTIWSIWMKLHRYVDHQRLHIVTKDVISLSISVLLLFRHYISHKITFGAPSSGGVLRSACGAFILFIMNKYSWVWQIFLMRFMFPYMCESFRIICELRILRPTMAFKILNDAN